MGQHKGRILCVEDHVDTSGMLAYWLRVSGYTFVPALTFADGLNKAHSGNFDAYIIDNRLPDGRGVDLCRQIRQGDAETPIIFYSADAYPHVIEEAFQAGANEYLVKPVNLSDLEKVIATYLASRTNKAAGKLPSTSLFNQYKPPRRLFSS